MATTTQTIFSDAVIPTPTTKTIPSDTIILVEQEKTLFSDVVINRNEPQLKLFASTAPTVEVGTASNPIVFSGVIAGEEFQHPDNPFFLFNDKGTVLDSTDAREVNFKILALEQVSETVGTSDGSTNQTFTVAFTPVINEEVNYPLVTTVGGVIWTRVDSLAGFGASDEIYTFNFTTGTITFGDNITGKVPPISNVILITYTPDLKDFGSEIASLDWFGVQSNGIINNAVLVALERQTSSDANTVTAGHTPLVAVTGVFLNSDPNRLGTNFFLPGGTFTASTGDITLGTALPSANEEVLIDYSYEIDDDTEPDFSDIGQDTDHTFDNPIPQNNAKKLNFRLVPPVSTSPSGVMDLRFRLSISFKG